MMLLPWSFMGLSCFLISDLQQNKVSIEPTGNDCKVAAIERAQQTFPFAVSNRLLCHFVGKNRCAWRVINSQRKSLVHELLP
jgi:hypothetical protein